MYGLEHGEGFNVFSDRMKKGLRWLVVEFRVEQGFNVFSDRMKKN